MSTECPYAALHQKEPHPDPYAVYAQMRAEHGPIVPVEIEPGIRGWLVTDYKTLLDWCRDNATFGRDARLWKDYREGRIGDAASVLPMMVPGPSALHRDGAEHQRYRRAIIDSFGGVSRSQLVSVTRHVAEHLVDTFCARGEADVLDEYARNLPLLVVSELLGLDEERGLRFAYANRKVWLGEDAVRAGTESEQVLAETVADKRENPGEDVTTRMLHHGSALSDKEVIAQMSLLVAVANEPTASFINSILRAVLTDTTGTTERFLTGSNLDDLVDRMLWQDPPVTNYPVMYPRVDVPLDNGRVIEAGSPILLAWAATNRFFAEENTEKIADSENRAHLSWGVGDHRCPFPDMARTIVTVAVRTLLSRLPEIRLAVPVSDLRWNLSGLVWVPLGLPVTFTPQDPRATEGEEDPSSPPDGLRPEKPSGRSLLSSLSSLSGKLLRGS